MPGTICPTSVKVAGKTLPKKAGNTDEETAKALVNSTDTPGSFYYNNSLNTTFIKIFDTMNDITVEVVFWNVLENGLTFSRLSLCPRSNWTKDMLVSRLSVFSESKLYFVSGYSKQNLCGNEMSIVVHSSIHQIGTMAATIKIKLHLFTDNFFC